MAHVDPETGSFITDDGQVHGFLPPDPPESPPNTFHAEVRTDEGWVQKTYEVDPEQCAAYYRAQGKTLPASVILHLPDGTSETHDWVGYGKRFREFHTQQPKPASAG